VDLTKGKKIVWFVVLLALLLPVYFRLIRPGFFFMQDDLQAFRIQQVDKCFMDGQFPCRWVPDAGYGYGYPQFIYYPPLAYYLGEGLHLMGFQFIDAVKALFVIGYILSAWGMFLLVSKVVKNRWSGLVSAILYTYVPYKAVEVYVRGAMSEFWSLVWFPFLFLFSHELIKERKLKSFISLSLAVGFQFLTHTLMSMIFFPVLGLWVVFWLIVEKRKIRDYLTVGFSGLLGVGLASFFVVPMLFERQCVHLESMLGGYFDYRAHFVSIGKLLFDFRWGYGSSGFPMEILNLSIGLPQWVLGVLAFLLAIKNFRKNRTLSLLTILLFLITLFVAFMIHQRSSFIWTVLPTLHFMQFPWRFLSVVVFLLAILGGMGIQKIGQKTWVLVALAVIIYAGFFKPRTWYNITDTDKFSGESWQKQQTISIFDYTPIYAKLPPPSKAPEVPEVLEGKVDFVNYIKGSNWQRGILKVESDEAVLRLPLFDFPGMLITVDGTKVDHWHNDCRNEPYCMGLITMKVSKGSREVEARLTSTWPRKTGDMVSVISWVTLIVLASASFLVQWTGGKRVKVGA